MDEVVKTTGPEAPRPKSTGVDLGEFGCLAIVVVALWFGIHWVAPNRKVVDGVQLEKLRSARAEFLEATALVFPGSDVRIEERRAGNVYLYVGLKSFEDIPFPDRDRALRVLGASWCSNLSREWANFIFLPSVSIRDIRSGKELGSYACTGEAWKALSK
jgi:hypothetical protein